MATYYKKITPDVMEERYAFFGTINEYIKEVDKKYELIVNETRTEQQVIAAGFDEIDEQEYLDYAGEISDFARIGSHPPQKPPAA